MSTKNCIQSTSQQNIDKGFASYLMGFIGVFCFNAYLFIYFFNGPAFSLSLGIVDIPAVLFSSATAAILLPIVRFKHYLFEGHSRILALKATGFIGTCLAPVGLFVPYLWISCSVLLGVGIISLGFLWALYMCRFTHQSVATLLSISAILSALLSALLLLRIETPPPATIAALVILGAVSWIAVFNTKDLMELSNILISPEESRKRAITVKIDRWTFSLIGLDLGFAIGITHYFLPDLFDASGISSSAAIFSIAAIAVGAIMLISHTRFDNLLESYSKDYLSFTYTLGLLLIFCLPTPLSTIGFAVILVVTFLQILIVINASIEFIRFEELNPLWYMAEEAFVAGGIAFGILVAWLSGAMSANSWSTLFYISCIVILMNIFAQSFINKGSFPSAEAIHLEDQPSTQPEEADDKKQDEQDAIRGEAWIRSVNRICKEYNLSPRQSEILKLLANGRDSIYIENYFCISKSTAKSHIYNIYRKLSIHSRQELIDIVERME